MKAATTIALLWLAFGGTHLGLALVPVRGALVSRFGEWGFRTIFSLIAAASFSLLVTVYSGLRLEGVAGLDLGQVPVVRWPLMAVVVAGIVLAMSSLVSYPTSPYAIVGGESNRLPRGIDRITRHAFFVGLALVALAHVLLAPRLVGAVFMAGFALLSIAGALHQDRKLLALRGRSYAEYVAVTSIVPFAAVLSGRQKVVWREIGWVTPAAGLALALGLRAVHDGIFSSGGAWVIGVTLAGAASATLQSWRREARFLRHMYDRGVRPGAPE